MVEVDPTLGPYCTQQRLDHYVEMAKELEATPDIGTIKVRYDATNDYVKVEFAIGGINFKIEGYKVYTVHRNNERDGVKYFYPNCGGRHYVVDYFTSGDYKEWKAPRGGAY